MPGFLKNQRIWGVTTFVNHVSDFVYVQLMRDLSLAEPFLENSATEKPWLKMVGLSCTTAPTMVGFLTMVTLKL